MDFEDPHTHAVRGRMDSELELARHVITVRTGANAGARSVCEAPVISIGSADGNDVVLRDGTVSRRHCDIALRDGRCILRDLGSTNGTFLNGVEVLEAILPRTARLTLGELELDCEWSPEREAIEPASVPRFGELFGGTEVMRRTFSLLARIAPTPLSCLILGETGTGKDLAARSLHAASARAAGPFVVFDCAGVQRNLVESQIFGHERGAFTGADRAHRGAFEQAQGGTLLLDEIGELPIDLQPRLLSALERREVTRLGGAHPIPVDVRIVAATHRDLSAMVRAGTFREDLFYRLAEVVVRLPPLRERLDDIELVAAKILEASFGERAPRLTDRAHRILVAHQWPGNVRELRNVLRRAAAFAPGSEIDAHALAEASQQGAPLASPSKDDARSGVELHAELPLKTARDGWIAELEAAYLAAVLARFGEDIDAAAVHVGVHRKSYLRLLREHGLRKE